MGPSDGPESHNPDRFRAVLLRITNQPDGCVGPTRARDDAVAWPGKTFLTSGGDVLVRDAAPAESTAQQLADYTTDSAVYEHGRVSAAEALARVDLERGVRLLETLVRSCMSVEHRA